MAKTSLGVVVQHVRQLVGCRNTPEDADHELLRRYTVGRDETAFATLVQRHGPMVWNVCRRAVGHHQDAEDVFQATFLVLARKASAIRWRASIVPWLYAVAQRLAAKARAEAADRPDTATVEPAAPDPFQAMTARELLTALDEEVAALSEHYRGPLVLCWLQGQSQEETARQLGTSLSTLRRRLESAKRLLHLRLTRRGLAPALTLGSLAVAAGPAPALTVSTPRAAALSQSLLAASTLKLKCVLTLLLAGLLAAGLALGALTPIDEPAQAVQPKGPPLRAAAKDKERRDLLGDPLPPGALLRLGTIRLRHGNGLRAVAWSPTADLLASGGVGETIRFWDPSNGKEVRSISGLDRGVEVLAFSPDGRWLAGAGDGNQLCLWEANTGKEVRRLDGPSKGKRGSGLVFASKGNLLVAASETSMQFWDPTTGKLLRHLKVDVWYAGAVACSADGRIVAAPGNDRAVHLWDTGNGQLLHTLAEHADQATTVVFSQDGKTVITTDVDNIWLWDTASGRKLNANNAMQNRRATFAALSPDGKLLAVGGDDGVIRLWDWAVGKQLLQLPRHFGGVRHLAFSGDGKTLAALAGGVNIHLWDVATGKPRPALPGHQERLSSVVWTPDGKAVVTAAYDGTVRLWNAQTGNEIRQLDNHLKSDSDSRFNPAALSQVAVSPDGKQVAAARDDDIVLVWDLTNGKVVHQFRADCVAFSPDGKLIALGGRGTQDKDYNISVIRLVDRGTGKELRELHGHPNWVGWVAFTPDSKTLISRGIVDFGPSGMFFRIWDVATGKEVKAVSAGPRVFVLALAPDGRTAAVLTLSQWRITLWETVTGQQRGELAGTTMDFDAAFAPNGRILAVASGDGTVRLWDLSSCKEIGCLTGHCSWALSVAFSPDGTKLVSGSLDTTALVWDVSRFTKRGPVVPLTAAELEACYADLADNAATAYRAIGKLVGSSKQAVTLLRERLKPALKVDAKAIAKLIGDLDSKQFQTRDKAMKELEKLEQAAGPALHKALAAAGTLEMRRRLELLLEKLDRAKLSPDILRQLRAIEVLEGIGGGDAKELLRGLMAAGASDALLTQEAQAALLRLK